MKITRVNDQFVIENNGERIRVAVKACDLFVNALRFAQDNLLENETVAPVRRARGLPAAAGVGGAKRGRKPGTKVVNGKVVSIADAVVEAPPVQATLPAPAQTVAAPAEKEVVAEATPSKRVKPVVKPPLDPSTRKRGGPPREAVKAKDVKTGDFIRNHLIEKKKATVAELTDKWLPYADNDRRKAQRSIMQSINHPTQKQFSFDGETVRLAV